MTKLHTRTLFTLLRGLLALGLLCSFTSWTQAAPKQKPEKKALPQMGSEVRTVMVKPLGGKGKKIKEEERKVHVTYSTPMMDAFIATGGQLYVQPKVSSQGNNVCGTIMIANYNIYSDNSGGRPRPKHRKMLSITSSVQPSKNPKTVTLKYELEKGVQCTLVYRFDGKEIEVEVVTEDPKVIDFPTAPRLMAKIPASHELPIDAPMGVKKSTTKDCLLNMKGKKYVYADFSKSTGQNNYVSYGSITGHWPGCELKFSGRPGLGLYVYAGSMLFEGYDLLAGGEKGATKKRMSIEVKKGK